MTERFALWVQFWTHVLKVLGFKADLKLDLSQKMG
jgi:hypothetical protein